MKVFQAVLALGAAALVAAGAFLFGISNLWNAYFANRAEDWSLVDAVVTSSAVSTPCGKNREFEPRIHYAYKVGNVSYEGDRINFAPHCGSERWAESVTTEFPVGKKIQIHVDPAAPTEAAIGLLGYPTSGEQSARTGIEFALAIVLAIGIRYFVPQVREMWRET